MTTMNPELEALAERRSYFWNDKTWFVEASGGRSVPRINPLAVSEDVRNQ